MKTRTSILALLASGILLSSGGVAMGVSGLAGSDSAGNAQYQIDVKDQAAGKPAVLGATATRPAGADAGVDAGDSRSVPASEVAQTTAQQNLADDTLPFTGYAAIPVLLLGLALLGAGMMMRRRTAADQRI